MCYIFQHIVPFCQHTSSIGVAALEFPRYKALILILEKVLNCRYDLISGPILLPSVVVFIWGNINYSDGSKSRKYGGWSTSSKPQLRTTSIATSDLCQCTLLEKKVQLGTLFVPYLEPSGKRVPKRVLYMF